MRKIQIGIMGSAADLKYSEETLNFAKELGKKIAESGNILVYGAESEYTSLSTEAAKEASKNGGLTVGVAGGKKKEVFGDYRPTVLISSGQEIGGGREFNLVTSCDIIIAISGGSGTLTEMAIAYQAGIPIIVIDKFGGWAHKLSDKYFDDRRRLKCIKASTPEEAVEKAISEFNKKQVRFVGIGDVVADVYYDKNEKLIGADGGITTHNIVCNLQSMGFKTMAFGTCGDDFLGRLAVKSLDDCHVENDIKLSKKINTRAYHIRRIIKDGRYVYKSIKYCPYCHKDSWYEESQIDASDILSKIKENDILIFDNLNEKNQYIIDNTKNTILVDLGLYTEFENLSKTAIIKKIKNKFTLVNMNERVEKYLLEKLNCKDDIELGKIFNAKLIIITRGSKGNDFIFNDTVAHFPIKQVVDEVDDSGAGDAFFSIFIRNWINNNREITKDILKDWFNDTLPYVKRILRLVGSRAHIKKMYKIKKSDICKK